MSTSVWLPLATLVAGYAGSLATEAFRDNRQEHREAVAREAEMRARRESRLADFQTETLLRLQDALIALNGVAADEFSRHARASDWDEANPGVEYVLAHRKAQADVFILVVRVADDRLRKLVNEFRGAVMQVGPAPTYQDGLQAVSNLGGHLEEVNKRLGDLLRGFY